MVLETIDFVDFISWFEGIGGFDIILPFLLIFAITFAILDKIKVFEKKNINTIIAIIVAFFLIMQRDAVLLIQGFLPRVSMIVLTILMVLLVAGAFGFGFGDSWQGLSVIIAIVSILWALGASVGWDVPWLNWFTDQDVAILLIVGIFVLVIWFIIKEPKTENEGGALKGIGSFISSLGKSVGGKPSK
ncbi:MAG: hypothetical protein KKG75_05395 [Nanoarchaeota archaeon]|nr:hypothetical protein [Nanoarchaeota archaeon]